jgi:trehalose-6-phosphate synthase
VDAVLVNPYDIDQMVDSMVKALTMPKAERRKRMSRMRAQVAKNTVYGWGDRIFEELEMTCARGDAP